MDKRRLGRGGSEKSALGLDVGRLVVRSMATGIRLDGARSSTPNDAGDPCWPRPGRHVV